MIEDQPTRSRPSRQHGWSSQQRQVARRPLRLDGEADVPIAQHIARTDDYGVVHAAERCSPLCLATVRGVVWKLMASRL